MFTTIQTILILRIFPSWGICSFRCKHPTQTTDLTQLGQLAISRIVRLVVLGDVVVFVLVDVPAGGARFEHHTHSLQIDEEIKVNFNSILSGCYLQVEPRL